MERIFKLCAIAIVLLTASNIIASVGEGVSKIGTLSSLTKKDYVSIGALNIKGTNINELSTNNFQISGNVTINDVLKFDGVVNADLNNLTVTGNCLIYIDGVTTIGKIDLYKGQFNFVVKDALLDGVLETANNLFELGKLPLRLDNIEILTDGIRLEGELKMPEVMGNYGAKITTLQITKTNGIDLVGGVHINSIGFKGLELKDLALNFNTIEKTFQGGGTLKTRLFAVDANVYLIEGKLDAIDVWIKLGKPIPLGSTGMSLSEGGGGIENILQPPIKLTLGVSLVPTLQGDFNVVELNQLKLGYTFGTKLEGTGNLLIFGSNLANAFLVITNSSTGIGGDVNIADILIGHANASISISQNDKLNFEGNLSASMKLPYKEEFPFDLIGTFIELPYTIASSENHILNEHIWGSVFLTSIFQLNYDLKWINSKIEADWSTNLNLWNKGLFGTTNLMSNERLSTINRFEGQSVIINPNKPLKNLFLKNSMMGLPITITTPTPVIILRLAGQNETPIYSVELPDGTIIDKDNVKNFSQFEYYQSDKLRKSFYLIKNPTMGTYKLNISNTNTYFLDVFGANVAPSIEMGSINQNGNDVEIKWNATDPDDNAKINLYYDTDNKGADGTLIKEGINEDDNLTSYTWSVSEMPSGNYYVYATIKDSTNSTVVSYSNVPVRIINSKAPEAPKNLQYTLTDSSVVLTWEKINTEKYNYNVYYSTNSELNFNSASFNLGDTVSFELKNLAPGKEYKFTVTAIDSLYNESELSNIIDVSFTSVHQNNSPVILEQEFPTTALTNNPLTYKIKTFDADGDALTFTIKAAPTGLLLDNTGRLTWTPTIAQSGNNFISFIVDDMKGLKDSAEFRINVLDSLSSKGNINFNKSFYTSYEDNPSVTLKDINLNISPTKIDSQQVHISSGKDAKGIDLMAKETQANSGVFTVAFSFSEESMANTSLGVFKSDSIYTEYNDNFPTMTVKAISYFYDSLTVNVKDEPSNNPKNYYLGNAYPNPFNPTTTIQYDIPEDSYVKINIFNSLGEVIKTLVDEEKTKGNCFVTWDGRNEANKVVSSGIYFFTFEATGKQANKIMSKKMILLK